MNKVILLQIAITFIKELLEFFGNSEVRTLAEIEDKLSRIMKSFIREIVKAYLELVDEVILKDKTSRKQRGLVVERRDNKRSVYTIFGDISFKRTYCFDKKQKAYVYPLDEALRLDKRQRLSQPQVDIPNPICFNSLYIYCRTILKRYGNLRNGL